MKKVIIPSVWVSDDTKTYPSKCSWCSYDPETGEFLRGDKFFDENMNEITEEEYNALIEKIPED